MCGRSVAASRTALKEGCGLPKWQHVKRDLRGQFGPIRESRRDQHPRSRGRQKVCYVIRRGNVVVKQQPCRALFYQPAQRGLRHLLDIGFFWRCRAQSHGKVRESTQEPSPSFGWTPANPRRQSSEAVRILNGQRSLTHTAHAVHGCATDRRLRHGSGLVLHQNGVEPVELVSAAREARNTRRHPDERSWRWLQGPRPAFHGGKDTAPTLLRVPDTNKVLIDVWREQTKQRGVLTTEDHHATSFSALGSVRFEACELHSSVR